MILATFSSCCCCSCSLLLLLFKRQPPDGKTPWQWRTEKQQNCDQKLPNVTSETSKDSPRMGKHRGSEGRKSSKIATKNNTIPLKDGETPKLHPENASVTSETHRKWCFWLLFPLAAAMNFSYLYIRSPNGKTPWKKSPPGGETPCLWRTEKPQNCTPKMPNVTSETHRKCYFWFLFLLAAAMNFGYLFLLLLQRLLLLLLLSLDGKTPWQWRTEKPQNCTT